MQPPLTDKNDMRISSVAAPVRLQVAASFRSAILSGRFSPGERLVEKDLCDLTGASRTTVREALRQLETEGLVELLPNKGPIVAAISAEQARSIYEVREALEALAGSLFVQRASQDQRDALEETVKQMAVAYKGGSIEEILAAKDRFYAVLLEGSGNEIIASTLKMMHARVNLLRRVSLGQNSRLPASLRELQAVIKAVKANDAKLVAKLCREHVHNASLSAFGKLGDSVPA
ncbi:GntR family transcriptional regulator [Devosia riboflavina]|uniref:GntR family transcriptional regulator n=1 Tax=Devosia riboflavina TaxID=46914 RepID=UPI0009FF2356|nr:GntR family transcriptional regulator [Devosia riboflavina]